MEANIFGEVAVLFLIMAAGFYARRRGMIDATVNRGLSELLLNVTLPLMIMVSFNFDFNREMLATAGKLFLISLALHVGLFFASELFYRRHPGDAKNVLRFTAMFSNCAYMGYPVLQSLYGKIGVFYASIFTVPFIITLWTLGVMLFAGEGGRPPLRKVLVNPGILAVAVGFVMFAFSLRFPAPIQRACELVGSTTTPLSMIVVGSMLAEMRFRDMLRGYTVYYGSLVRLVVIPLLVLGVLLLLGVKGTILGICVISMAMPAAANTAAFAEKYQSDTALASRCVFLTTVLSMFTIPIFIALVEAAIRHNL